MEDSLHYLIMANQMLVQRGLLERLKNTGLTIGQPKVLDYQKDHDGSSQKEIARNCFLEAGSLTSILNRMEEKGLIERRMLNGNRRTFHIYLTKEGWKSQKLVEESFLEIEKAAASEGPAISCAFKASLSISPYPPSWTAIRAFAPFKCA